MFDFFRSWGWWKRKPYGTHKQIEPYGENGENRQHKDAVKIVSALNHIANQLEATKKEKTCDDKRAGREKVTIFLLFWTFVAAAYGDVIFYHTEIDAGRAWIRPIIPKIGPLPSNGKPIDYAIAFENSGRGPATEMNWTVDNGYVDRPATHDARDIMIPPNTTCERLKPSTIGAVEFPYISLPAPDDKPHSMGARSDTATHPTHMDESLRIGTRYFYIQGCIVYSTMDIVGHSQFCFYVRNDPENGLIALECPSGNSAD